MADVVASRASARFLPISPQKLRLVVDVVRGMDAENAMEVLRFMPHKGASYVFKIVESAIANAENSGFETDDLYVQRIFADDGPRRRKGRFAGRGRYKPLINRSAHVTVVLAERDVEDIE